MFVNVQSYISGPKVARLKFCLNAVSVFYKYNQGSKDNEDCKRRRDRGISFLMLMGWGNEKKGHSMVGASLYGVSVCNLSAEALTSQVRKRRIQTPQRPVKIRIPKI